MRTDFRNLARPALRRIVEVVMLGWPVSVPAVGRAQQPGAIPHYLLSTTYRHMGNTAEAQAEMDQFQKLTAAQNERRRPSDAILAGAGEQRETIEPKEEDAPDAQ